MKQVSISNIALVFIVSLVGGGFQLTAQSALGHIVAGPAWNRDAAAFTRVSPPGRTQFSVGGGGELRARRIVGFGIDALGISTSGPSASRGLLSLNGYAHFRENTAWLKWDPFLTGGYSVLFRPGSKSGWNIGGGANYWFRSRLGGRVEIRDSLFSDPGRTRHLWTARFGIVIR